MPSKYRFRWIHGMCTRFGSKQLELERPNSFDFKLDCWIISWDSPILNSNTTGRIVNCTKDDVIYDTRQFTSTIKSEFKLSCGDGMKNSLGKFPSHFDRQDLSKYKISKLKSDFIIIYRIICWRRTGWILLGQVWKKNYNNDICIFQCCILVVASVYAWLYSFCCHSNTRPGRKSSSLFDLRLLFMRGCWSIWAKGKS